MALTLLLIAAITVAVSWVGPVGPTLSGRATIVDGDTLRIGQTRIRLLGIDAPELDQSCSDASGQAYPCGTRARQFLADLASEGPVSCVASGHDRYRRVLAHCSADTTDLSRAMVDAGWAIAEPDYLVAQLAARSAGRGLWAGRFEQPSDWRRDHGEQGSGFVEWLQGLLETFLR